MCLRFQFAPITGSVFFIFYKKKSNSLYPNAVRNLCAGESVPSRGCPSRLHLKVGAVRKDAEGRAGVHQKPLFAFVVL
jgi:hypothetical protein